MSSLTFSKKIARRYLWSKRSEAFITIITIISIIGIAVGVTVLNIVMAVMTGFQHDFREKIVGADSHVVVQKLGERITHWREIGDKIRSVPGVSSVSAYTYHQALLRSNDRSSGLLVRGIEEESSAASQLQSYLRNPDQLKTLFNPPPTNMVSSQDDQTKLTQLPGIIIGRELSVTLGILPGTPISLLSPSVSSSPFGLVPQFRRFVVVGTYHSGLVEYESSMAYVSLPEAQAFFHMGDAISGFEVRVNNVDNAPEVAHAIVDTLTPLYPGIYARDWTERNKDLWEAISLEKRVYFLVLLLIVVMASISIVSTLIMIVLEKRKDIAIMMTMGASSRSIATIFFLQGATIGAIGTILGLIMGYLGCMILTVWGFPLPEKVFQMSSLPVRIEWINFVSVGIASFVISCLATLYPAWRASRLEPLEVLRYE